MTDSRPEGAISIGPDKTLLPHSIEAEQSLIGCLLLNNDDWIKVCDLISDRDFYKNEHRHIFRHISTLLKMDLAVTVATVLESIRNSNEIDQTGGESYLTEIVNGTRAPTDIRYFALIVNETSLLRSLIDACDQISRNAFNGAGRDCQHILDEAASLIFSIVETNPRSRRKLETLSDALHDAVTRIKTLGGRDTQDELSGIATGYTDLDKFTSGFQRGDVVVISGSPSMGQSATLALNIAEHVGVDLGLPVLIFSFNVSAQELALRFLSSQARVDIAELRSDHLTDKDRVKVTCGLDRLHDAKIYIHENDRIHFPDIRAQARRLHRKCLGLGLIVIEDIEMIVPSNNSENRAFDLDSISSNLKRLAQELEVVVVVLSPLCRKVIERTDTRLLMFDVRELGGIERDADLVMLLSRDESIIAPDSNESAVTNVHIGKNRNGLTGEFRLAFLGEYCRFESLAHPRGS